MGHVPDDIARLARIADSLGRSARRRNPAVPPLPTLWLFTDPERTPDILAAAARLPRGSGIVLRTFGHARWEAAGPDLADFARQRGLVLLVGADEGLAARIGADGLHLPERLLHRIPRLRARQPGWRITGAAHGAAALRRAERSGADAVFLSPVLPSRSRSAGAPLGSARTALLVRGTGLPVFGLGGVDARTATSLIRSGLSGLAGVEFAAQA